MTIFLMEDHELPLIEGFAFLRAGSRNEPPEKAGMGEILSEAWRAGGTRTRSGDALDDFLEARAARVETEVDTAMTTVSLSCLKADFDDVLGVFVDLLREPAFAPEKIEIARAQAETAISRRNDSPGQLADRESRRLVYGADSPYARWPEYATVAAVTRADLLAWQHRYVHPNRILLGLVGDFEAKAMEARLRKAFGPWPRGPEFTDPDPVYRQAPRPGVFLVEKDDVNQSSIRLVHLGTTRRDADFFALEVLNQLFSGTAPPRASTSMSGPERDSPIRSGAGSRANTTTRECSRSGVGTKSETTAAGIDALNEEIVNIVGRPPDPQELQGAKDAILNSFVFRFDSRRKILREQMVDAYYGYPGDFLERYRTAVEKVTAEDVARAARNHIHKDRLALLVVGKPSDFDRPLSSFGPVTKLDVSIPRLPEKK